MKLVDHCLMYNYDQVITHIFACDLVAFADERCTKKRIEAVVSCYHGRNILPRLKESATTAGKLQKRPNSSCVGQICHLATSCGVQGSKYCLVQMHKESRASDIPSTAARIILLLAALIKNGQIIILLRTTLYIFFLQVNIFDTYRCNAPCYSSHCHHMNSINSSELSGS